MDRFMSLGDKRLYSQQAPTQPDMNLRDSISRSFISKKELPTLMGGPKQAPHHPPTSREPATVSSKSAFETVLRDIDTMNETFDHDEEEIDERDFVMFKDNVKSWMELDTRMSELDKTRRELAKRKSQYNEEIIRFMKKYNVEDLNLDDGEMLKFETRQSKGGISGKQLKENIHNFFIQNMETANKLMTYLEQERKTQETYKLRRCKN